MIINIYIYCEKKIGNTARYNKGKNPSYLLPKANQLKHFDVFPSRFFTYLYKLRDGIMFSTILFVIFSI